MLAKFSETASLIDGKTYGTAAAPETSCLFGLIELAGKYKEVAADATAFGPRDPSFWIVIYTAWASDLPDAQNEQRQSCVQWARDLCKALEPYSTDCESSDPPPTHPPHPARPGPAQPCSATGRRRPTRRGAHPAVPPAHPRSVARGPRADRNPTGAKDEMNAFLAAKGHEQGGEELHAKIRSMPSGPIYERLRDVKTKFDPANLFRANQNIPPRS